MWQAQQAFPTLAKDNNSTKGRYANYVSVRFKQAWQTINACTPRKARLLLKEKKAKVVMQTPFTIQLFIRKSNKAVRWVKGFQLFDKVDYLGTACFIFGRRSSGYFDLRLLNGTVIHRSASFKQLKPLERANTWLIESPPRLKRYRFLGGSPCPKFDE